MCVGALVLALTIAWPLLVLSPPLYTAAQEGERLPIFPGVKPSYDSLATFLMTSPILCFYGFSQEQPQLPSEHTKGDLAN